MKIEDFFIVSIKLERKHTSFGSNCITFQRNRYLVQIILLHLTFCRDTDSIIQTYNSVLTEKNGFRNKCVIKVESERLTAS